MKAAFTPNYGPAQILETREVATPTLEPNQVLVEVKATPVTAGDRRLRAADFPAISKIPGHLMMGIARPRNPIQGTMFAGVIAAVGSEVTEWAVGDEVFGSADNGTYAEYVAVPADGPMARIPDGLSYAEAAEVPYGAVTALRFLHDLGGVQPGERVLILGASGGVGRYAVQLARHFGAEVTGVASGANEELVRELGADHFLDYRTQDWTTNGETYDLIFDVADTTNYGVARHSLSARGRYLTLFVSLGVLLASIVTSMLGDGRRAMFGVALQERRDLDRVKELLELGAIWPVVAEQYPFAQIVDAHQAAETSQPGGILVTMTEPLRAVTAAAAE